MPELPDDIAETVARALAEDVGPGDLTAGLLEPDVVTATVIAREDAVLCGTAWFGEVFRQLNENIQIQWEAQDGEHISADAVLCTLQGPVTSLLTGERTALNFLQTLSGTATITRQYADAIKHTKCKVLDTRKTIPGLRLAQKYAVACGGGVNHRVGLYDAILIKENHIAAAGSIRKAIGRAREQHPGIFVEVEVENLAELEQAMEAGPDRILLDNFSIEDLKQAVTLNCGCNPLEASGNITLDNITLIAETGVDFISIGALTKHVRAIDLSMRII